MDKLNPLVERISTARDTDIVLINSPMDGQADVDLIKIVTHRRRRKNVLLILVTEGGSADIGFRIARCLQACYTTFTAVIPGWCKSSGTLICIGAKELLIGDVGELGPLDVQVAKQDELGLVSSGLTMESSFRSLQSAAFQTFERNMLDVLRKSGGRITTKTAAEIAVSMTVGLFSPIFQQMDPLKIGEDYRATRIGEEYALRLNVHAQNLAFAENEDPIDALVRGYPSHGFVIDRTEAKQHFRRVGEIEGELLELVELIGPAAMVPRAAERAQKPIIQYLCDPPKHVKTAKDSEESRDVSKPPLNATAGKPSGRKSAVRAAAGASAVSGDHSAGDRVVPLPVPDRPQRAVGKGKTT